MMGQIVHFAMVALFPQVGRKPSLVAHAVEMDWLMGRIQIALVMVATCIYPTLTRQRIVSLVEVVVPGPATLAEVQDKGLIHPPKMANVCVRDKRIMNAPAHAVNPHRLHARRAVYLRRLHYDRILMAVRLQGYAASLGNWESGGECLMAIWQALPICILKHWV